MKQCPRCQWTPIVKNGFANQKQRYKCKQCEYQFTRTTPRGHPPAHKKLTVLLYCHGMSMNAISKLFQASSTPVALELDEMWHYIKNKKNKLWIWKALDRNTGHLIDWECGGRDKQTFEKLMTRLTSLDVTD